MRTYDIRRAASRTVTRTEGRETWHSFAFGDHYDAANVSFGSLLAHNDDTLAPGAGYDVHRHRDVEIVTWVLAGELTHEDADERLEVVRPGWVQWVSAGRGIEHSERNESDLPVRFVQIWLRPQVADGEPGYVLRDVGGAVTAGSLAPVLQVGPAVLHAGRLCARGGGELAPAAHVHLYVARGTVTVAGVGEMAEGDALRVNGSEGGSFVAGEQGADLLVWAMAP